MRQRGSAWRWAWMSGFVLLCFYIAFDVLDFDGSQLPHGWGSAIVETDDTGDAERMLRGDPAFPSPQPPSSVRASHVGRCLDPAIPRFRPVPGDRFRPREYLAHQDSRTIPQSSDPA